MTLRSHHLVATLFAGALVLGSLAFLTVNPQTAQASCPTGSSIVVTSPSNNSTATPISGVFNLQAMSTPTTATGVSFMLYPAQQPLGEATQNGTSWNLSWDTRNQPNGGYQVVAIAHFSGTTSLDCASAAVPVYLENVATQSPQLKATIIPNTWQGTVGSTGAFTVDTIYIDQYGRQSHVAPSSLSWYSPLGSISPPGALNVVFKAGAAGIGPLKANISYMGLNVLAEAQLKVTTATTSTTASPTPTPTPTTTTATSGTSPTPTPTETKTTETISTEDAARLSAMPTIFRPAAPTNSDPVVNLPTLSCLEKAMGSVRFTEISSGKSQPTAAERKRAAACFARTEPIPAVLAPVAPLSLVGLEPTTNVVTLASIKNHTTTSTAGVKVNGLLLTGKGAPNTNIFIYVFSDPLVLRAETDSQGNWSYVLETPLQPGNHEVYAVAEKDGGDFVRTSAIPITVATAATGGQDGKILVESKISPVQMAFAGGALVLVVAALIGLFALLHRRRHPAQGTITDSVAPVATPPTHSVSGLIQPQQASALVPPQNQPPTPPSTPPVAPSTSPSPSNPINHDVQL